MLADVRRVITEPRWYDELSNLAQLIRWLGVKGVTNAWDADDYARLIDEPWKWDPEWAEYQAVRAELEAGDPA